MRMKRIKTYSIVGEAEDVGAVEKIVSRLLEKSADPDVLLVVGGDGVILDPEIKAEALKRPVLRVHHRPNSLKSLGFAADVNLSNLEQALKDLKEGDYSFEDVGLLKCRVVDGGVESPVGFALVDVDVEAHRRGSCIMFRTVVRRPDGSEERLPTPKCTGAVVTGPYGSTAWNLALGGPVAVDPEFRCLLVNLREAPVKPDKFLASGDCRIEITVLEDAVVKMDRDELALRKGQTLAVGTDDEDPCRVRFVRTLHTRESLMDKLLRFSRFQYGRVSEGEES